MAAEQRKELKELLNAFVDEDITTAPLCAAAEKGNVGLVVALLNKFGADKNFNDTRGTPLILAAFEGHLPVVEVLLAAGADIDITAADDGNTAIYEAAYEGNDEVVKALLDAGAKQNANETDGDTPLIAASRTGRLSIVNTLMAYGADVNNIDSDGASALSTAAFCGYKEVVLALLREKADVNMGDETPLMMAISGGYRCRHHHGRQVWTHCSTPYRHEMQSGSREPPLEVGGGRNSHG